MQPIASSAKFFRSYCKNLAFSQEYSVMFGTEHRSEERRRVIALI